MLTLMLIVSTAYSAEFKPKYGPNAVPLSVQSNTEYFQKNKAPDFWTLIPYYIPQETGSGCSAANMVWILNAARVGMKLSSDDELVSFKNFVEKYAEGGYKKRIQSKLAIVPGNVLANRNLAKVLKSAAEKLKIYSEKSKIEFHEVNLKNLKPEFEGFIAALEANEKSADDYIFFSFIQGKITGDPEGGAHVATVAAYDANRKLVLVLDPDRKYYEPYWTPAEKLFEAITDPESDSEQRTGWIYFKVR